MTTTLTATAATTTTATATTTATTTAAMLTNVDHVGNVLLILTMMILQQL